MRKDCSDQPVLNTTLMLMVTPLLPVDETVKEEQGVVTVQFYSKRNGRSYPVCQGALGTLLPCLWRRYVGDAFLR